MRLLRSSNPQSLSGFWSAATLRKLSLITQNRMGRWWLLVTLAVMVSAVEFFGTILVFSLLSRLVSPDAPVDIPFLGTWEAAFPNATNESILVALAVGVAAFFLLRATIVLFKAYAQGRIIENAGARISDRLLRGYLSMPYGWHLTRDPAELFRNAYAAVGTLLLSVFAPLISIVSELFVVVAIASVLLILRPAPTLITMLAFAPVVIFLMLTIQQRMRRHGRAAQTAITSLVQSLEEGLRGIREIALYGKQGTFREVFWRNRLELARVHYIRTLLNTTPRLVIETTLVLLVSVLAIVAVLFREPMTETLTLFGLLGYAAFRIMPSISIIVTNLNELRFGEAVVDDIYRDIRTTEQALNRYAGPPASLEAAGDTGKYSDTENERASTLLSVEPGSESNHTLPFRNHLEAERVTFYYPGASSPALVDISFRLHAGESVGIVGRTGCGKSTLIDLLLGLLTPTEGRIVVDGIDISEDVRSWQQNLAIVPQTLFLINSTVRKNVTLSSEKDEVDDERFRTAIEQAQLRDVVQSLPEGAATVIGNQGIRLSGGQRQRLVIARALYRNPRVLVFDEGTASLDQRTEADILEAIESARGDRTLIHVAHRLASVRNCDRVLLLDSGRLIASGTFDSLMEDEQLFRDMAET